MQNIKKIYLYLVSVITLVITVWGGITLVNMALKTWVFTKADRDYYSYPLCPPVVEGESRVPVERCNEEEQRQRAENARSAQRQRDAAQAIAMIIIAGPVWYLHWTIARKEK